MSSEFDRIYSDSWMNERINIFLKNTLPSVLGQSQPNFRWIIFFDEERSKPYQRFLDDLRGYGVDVRFASGHNGIISELRGAVYEVNSRFERALVTRLDCDDAIKSNFIEKIQCFRGPSSLSSFIIDFPFLEVRDFSGNVGIAAYFSHPSAFYTHSYSLRSSDPFDMYNHTKIPKSIKIERLNGIGAIQYIHDGNVSNQMPSLYTTIRHIARYRPFALPSYAWLKISNRTADQSTAKIL